MKSLNYLVKTDQNIYALSSEGDHGLRKVYRVAGTRSLHFTEVKLLGCFKDKSTGSADAPLPTVGMVLGLQLVANLKTGTLSDAKFWTDTIIDVANFPDVVFKYVLWVNKIASKAIARILINMLFKLARLGK